VSARRALRRLCFAGAAFFAVSSLAATGAPAHADTAPPPGSNFATFGAVADAAGVFQEADKTVGFLPTFHTIYGRLPDGQSRYASQLASARASVYFPGEAVIGLSPLLCTADLGSIFGLPPSNDKQVQAVICHLPPYPLFAQADLSHPDAAVNSPAPSGGAGSPVGIGAANAVAHAGLDGTRTDAVIANYDTPQGTGAVVHVGSLEAKTGQFIDAKGLLHDEASATLSGIDILGGLIHIDGISALSSSVADGSKPTVKAQNFHVNGVTVNGIPATIGSDGISVNGSGSGKPLIDTANSLLQSALKSAGLTVRVLGPTKTSLLDRACTGGDIDGVEILGNVTVTVPPNLGATIENLAGQVDGTYFMHVVLGAACTDASAFLLPPGSLSTPADTGGTGGVSAPPLSSASGSGSALGSTGTFAPSQSPASGGLGLPRQVASGPASVAARPARRSTLGGLESELASHRVTRGVTALYLAFTLLAAGLCLGLLRRVPDRFAPRL
jgi:hypothetical protein